MPREEWIECPFCGREYNPDSEDDFDACSVLEFDDNGSTSSMECLSCQRWFTVRIHITYEYSTEE